MNQLFKKICQFLHLTCILSHVNYFSKLIFFTKVGQLLYVSFFERVIRQRSTYNL